MISFTEEYVNRDRVAAGWQWVEVYHHALIKYAMQFTPIRAQAEDWVGVAILKTPQTSRKWNARRAKFTTYMMHYMHYWIRHAHQKDCRRGRSDERIPQKKQNHERACIIKAEAESILASVREIDPDLETVLREHFIHNMPVATIANKYRTSRSKVGKLIDDALREAKRFI